VGKFISLFAGVGGFDLGMEQAGHECVAQVEWDKNAAGVLKHRWPNVPLFCDVSKVSADDLPDADFITYGFPCQDLSVAGKREGLDGKRSGLFYEATRLIRELIARGSGLRFAVAENVRGALSADDGLALARCIRELLDCGASEVGYVVLDSQYFGVAQRRKRVFIVSDFGGESCDEILAITESLPGHPAPSREAGKGTAGDATKGVGDGSIAQGADVYNGQVTGETSATVTSATGIANASGPKVIEQKETYCLQGGGKTSQSSQGSGVNKDVSFTLNGLDKHGVAYEQEGIANASGPKVIGWNGDTTPKASEDVSVTLRSQQGGEGVGVAHEVEPVPLDMRQCTRDPEKKDEMNRQSTGTGEPGDPSYTLTNGATPGVAFGFKHGQSANAKTLGLEKEVSPTLLGGDGGAQKPAVLKENLTVRRLTPIECERLQGFPDNWTAEKMELVLEGNEWKATGKTIKQADGPRYKQLGNAVTVNVAEYLGKQIAKVL